MSTKSFGKSEYALSDKRKILFVTVCLGATVTMFPTPWFLTPLLAQQCYGLKVKSCTSGILQSLIAVGSGWIHIFRDYIH